MARLSACTPPASSANMLRVHPNTSRSSATYQSTSDSSSLAHRASTRAHRRRWVHRNPVRGERVLQSWQNFGNNCMTRIQLGGNTTGRVFDPRLDEITIDTGAISAPVDTRPPETTLTSAPSATTSETTATFAFTANELATSHCSLDGVPVQPCISPTTYTAPQAGLHTFSMTAADLAGNTDPTSPT